MATGYHDFTPGETLTAANLEDFCMRQSVMVFATAAARNSALAAVLQEGMCAYLQDANVLTIYSGAAWSTVGPLHGVWSTWVPAVVQSGSVTVTVNRASHIRVGRMLQVDGFVSVTGTGSASNLVTVSLPAAASSSNANTILGAGYVYDSSAGFYFMGVWVLNSASTAKLQITTTGAAVQYAGLAQFTAALASSDLISFNWNYELAADA